MIVAGLVHGVFFRDTCRRVAGQQGVAGWVRNRPDGTVEAVFEGAAERVDRMVSWARHGPAGAAVERVRVTEEPPEGLSRFEIR